ncbi:MAG: hypothetical protein ACOY46_20265 [Bacillota bacterium]
MENEKGALSCPTFEQEFANFVTERVAAAGRAMPSCSVEEYQSFTDKHSQIYTEICGRLGEGDRDLLAEFDFVTEALSSFDADSAYIQGFADGIAFMGMFKNTVIK